MAENKSKFKFGDIVVLIRGMTIPVTTRPNMVYVNQLDTPVDSVFKRLELPKGTLLKVIKRNVLAGQLVVAPVNEELMLKLESYGCNSLKVDSTNVELASGAARVLYG
jgi:hypothetical protein